MSTKRFRIAFSFAGEKRAYVEQVAELLAQRFGHDKILYDKYHKAEFANADLAFDLPAHYKSDSDLVVAVFSEAYEKKEWCGLEYRAIFSMVKEGQAKQVLLSRFDLKDGKGLYGLAGFIELEEESPAEFATLILQRLALNEGQPKDHYTQAAAALPKPRTSIPHNLPALQAFFGREDELRRMAEALDPEARTWGALIDGPGGMGKTSLAVRAAYAAPPQHFKKIVFASLKARELDDDGLRDLSGFLISGLQELLGELARELGAEDLAKASPEHRPRLLLEALRDTQTLLVLDNLESLTKPERDTVFNLVKRLPPGCKAILTSRGRIGSGAEEIILEKLGEQAALDTLAELAQRNPLLATTGVAERLTLYRETGGKPLLLRWTAGQIGRGHCRSFSDALDFLRSCPTGNDPLEFVFGDLVDEFSDEETQTLCALSYFSQSANLEHIAAIADLDTEICDRALRSLANRSLVRPNEELTAFTLIPLVTAFLSKKRPEVMAATRERLEQRMFSLIASCGFDSYRGFPALEAAWPSIAPAVPVFLAGDNTRLQAVFVGLKTFLAFQGRWDELLALCEKVEVRSIVAADYLEAGWRAHDAGNTYLLLGRADEAIACATRAATHWARTTKVGVRERAVTARLQGLGLGLKGDSTASAVLFEQSLALFRELPRSEREVGIALHDLATAKEALGDIQAAEQLIRESIALALSTEIEDKESLASNTSWLSKLALKRRDWMSAETLAREALKSSSAIHRKDFIGSNQFLLAVALLRQGRPSDALIYAQSAVEIATELKLPHLAEAQTVLSDCVKLAHVEP